MLPIFATFFLALILLCLSNGLTVERVEYGRRLMEVILHCGLWRRLPLVVIWAIAVTPVLARVVSVVIVLVTVMVGL